MLVAIIGAMGSGKTLLMVFFAFLSTREIYSNFRIHLNRFKTLEVMDLLELKDNIDVFIDEGYTWLESRTSGSVLSRYLSYIVLQSRKRTIDIIISAQMFSSLDIRFREQCDLIIKCEKIFKKKKIAGFKYTFLFVESNLERTFFLDIKKASKYFDLYDTLEIIEPHKIEQMKLKLMEQDNPKGMWDELERISEIIRNDLKEFSHPAVLNSLMRNGFKASYEPQIYSILKDVKIEI